MLFLDNAVAEALTGDALIQLHSTLRDFPENAMDDGPKHLEVELLIHQKKALAWALWREGKHPQGGILGMWRMFPNKCHLLTFDST